MPNLFSLIDDKHVPVYRVVWVADTPHFCGNEECEFEGRYEVRLEAEESVFGTREERDGVLETLEIWHGTGPSGGESDWS